MFQINFSIVLVMRKTSWIQFNVCNVTETWKHVELTFKNGISSMPTDSQVHLTNKVEAPIQIPHTNFPDWSPYGSLNN